MRGMIRDWGIARAIHCRGRHQLWCLRGRVVARRTVGAVGALVVLGVVRNLLLLLLLLLLLRRRWTLDLLDIGRLMLGRHLGVWMLRRGVVALCWRLGGG